LTTITKDSRNHAAKQPRATALLIAQNSSTPPEKLAELLRHRDTSVRRALALNPNIDFDTLNLLARLFPDEIARNPILDWLLLENANWPDELHEISRARLLACSSAPVSLLWWAVRNGTYTDHLAITQSPNATIEILAAVITETTDELVKMSAALHVREVARHEQPGNAKRVAKQADDNQLVDSADHSSANRDDDLVHAVLVDAAKATATSISTEALITIGLSKTFAPWLLPTLRSADAETRRLLVNHPATTAQDLAAFAFDDDEEIRRLARVSPRLEKSIRSIADRAEHQTSTGVGLNANDATAIMQLSTSSFAMRVVATIADLDAELFLKLARSDDWKVRETAAKNVTVTENAMRRLVVDTDRDVRAALASNPFLTHEIVDLLTYDRQDSVQDAIQQHPRFEITKQETTKSFAQRKSARSHIQRPPQWLIDALPQHPTAAILLASHPNTPASSLAAFLEQEWRVRQAVANNPRIEPELLVKLSTDPDGDVREAVVRNPNFTEELALAMHADENTLVRVALASHRFTNVLPLLAQDSMSAVREALAKNPHTPSDLLIELAATDDHTIRMSLAVRDDLPYEALLRLCTATDDESRRTLFGRPDATREVVDLLVASGSPATISATRMSRAATTDLLMRVRIGDGSLDAGAAKRLLANADWVGISLVVSDAPTLFLDGLARSTDWRIRQQVANHKNTTTRTLTALAKDNDYDVRAAAVGNPNFPRRSLSMFCDDPHQLVRLSLARRTDTPARVLASLLIDESDDVIRAALENPSTPQAAKKSFQAIDALTELSDELAAKLSQGGPSSRIRVAELRTVSKRLLRTLSQDNDWRVRERVARNTNTSAAVLSKLAQDGDRDIRRGTASNPSIAEATLGVLINDEDPGVRSAALANPKLTSSIRTEIFARTTRKALASRNATDRLVALACQAPIGRALRYQSFWCSTNFLERYCVAVHPRTPTDVLEKMTRDANHLVRNVAVASLGERST
jgi:Leucine rich repeat variant